eukprot:CAMPEP_0171141328 /NCGR_PEP_ID=MMETSP0766_2-20121228/140442_1 /TAXON_ID=439317 /ORGANISM="Gambierdiscus australes, Strain CAWD 149" /LENGTH=53 /DNA_ID=CAMNT_0011605053 /DNA_START=242 /DNA_END=403 /DNA_ORIENTATION=+
MSRLSGVAPARCNSMPGGIQRTHSSLTYLDTFPARPRLSQLTLKRVSPENDAM